jgi:hypothetical protein
MNTKNRNNGFTTFTLIATEKRFMSDLAQVARMLTKSLGHLCHVVPPQVFVAEGGQESVSNLIKLSDITIVFSTPKADISKVVEHVRGVSGAYVFRVVRLKRCDLKPRSLGVDRVVYWNEIFFNGHLARWRVEDRFCNLARLQ